MAHNVNSQLQFGDPLTSLLNGRAAQRAICDDLEKIADQLGGQIDRQQFAPVLEKLFRDLPIYHGDEEALYRILRDGETEQTIIAECADQAIRDHRHFQDYALEIGDAVQDHFTHFAKGSSEALGYTLRCAFEGLRQHMAWEDVTLLGGLLRPLTAAEAAEFQNLMVRNRSFHGRRAGLTD